MLLSAGSAVRALISDHPQSHLAKTALALLHEGGVVPHSIVSGAAALVANRAAACVYGLVMDGFPQTANQVCRINGAPCTFLPVF